MEKSFYNIYYNKELDEAVLNTFNRYELSLLKNMVFAKYNYKFSNPFYQAYFNTFYFYGTPEMRSVRTKDVNSKLTEADLNNLSIINEALKEIRE